MTRSAHLRQLGEDQVVRKPITLKDDCVLIYTTMHPWHKAQDFETIKNLGDAIRKAMRSRFVVAGMFVAYHSLENVRYMRDPGGEYIHGVITYSLRQGCRSCGTRERPDCRH